MKTQIAISGAHPDEASDQTPKSSRAPALPMDSEHRNFSTTLSSRLCGTLWQIVIIFVYQP